MLTQLKKLDTRVGHRVYWEATCNDLPHKENVVSQFMSSPDHYHIHTGPRLIVVHVYRCNKCMCILYNTYSCNMHKSHKCIFIHYSRANADGTMFDKSAGPAGCFQPGILPNLPWNMSTNQPLLSVRNKNVREVRPSHLHHLGPVEKTSTVCRGPSQTRWTLPWHIDLRWRRSTVHGGFAENGDLEGPKKWWGVPESKRGGLRRGHERWYDFALG